MPIQENFPGVYIEEIPAEVKTITGVPTSTTAFFGRTTTGSGDQAIRCASYADFLRNFGDAHPQSDLKNSIRQFFDNGGSDCYVIRVKADLANTGCFLREWINGTRDGTPLTAADFIGDRAASTGFYALDKVDLFNLMVIPGDVDLSEAEYLKLSGAAGVYCEQKRAFLLLDAPASWTRDGALAAGETDIDSFRGVVTVSQNAAVFYPRIKFSDEGITKTIGVPGMIAGLIARTDSQRGVWKSPAGTEAVLLGALDVELNLDDKQNDFLNRRGVNCIRKFPNGIVNWGARTLDGADNLGSEWKYITIRRLAMYLEESLYRGTRWAVFEPNDEPLWAKVRMNVGAFMMNLFRQGAFQGSKPEQAFFVKCGTDTTTLGDIDAGIINIQIGFAPLKPAEFVIINIRQMTSDKDP